MQPLKTSFITAVTTLSLAAGAQAATLGPGTSILGLPSPNNQVDTPSGGGADQSRQNLDLSFTATLPAGVYEGLTWTFQAGQTGSVIPYIAYSTGPSTYQILAVGSQVDVSAGDLNLDMTVPFGGSPFTLASATELFGGIVNPTVAGSQNPVYTNLNSGGFMDHDNNADGNLSPAVVGGSVDGFGHANLPRSYAFSIEVEAVPEPTTSMFTLFGFGALILLGLRRRRP